ncbi:hypothetical protein AUJ68_03410 [Candidatus Woesearchaeota archaeon CG1_02_57_44]|nr:MAG: hypothetical protein AUJ68_03410 [Candidatus Woesearchaeota archaeon CG1_02_57_44]
MSITALLTSWAERFVRHRNLLDRKVQNIGQDEDTLIVTRSDGTWHYIAQERLDLTAAGPTKEGSSKAPTSTPDRVILVVPNTKDNLKHLQTNWPAFAKRKDLQLIFVNPSSPAEKWIINPHMHSRIADPESLNMGLQSMFDEVGEVTADDMDTLARSKEF